MRTEHEYDKLWDEVYGDIQDYGPTHRHIRRILKTLLNELDYSTVLEVGFGFGHNFPLLLKFNHLPSIDGIDISRRAIEYVSSKYKGDFQLLDIQKEHLPKQWDIVFSSLVLEHLTDDLSALQHIRAMTSKYALLITMAGNFEKYAAWDRQQGHVRNYKMGELEKKCNDVGLFVLKSIYWGFPFYSPIARTLQNKMKPTHKFNRKLRLLAEIMYWLFFLNSKKRGDIIFVLASPDGKLGQPA